MLRSAFGKLSLVTFSLIISFSSIGQNNSLSFDGSDDYVSIGNMGVFPSEGTFEAWIFSDVNDSNHGVMDTDLANNASGLRIETSAANDLYLYNDEDATFHYFYTSGYTTSQWNHMAFTWNTGNNALIGYLDGVEVFNANVTSWPANLQDFALGVAFQNTGTRIWDGNIDEVRIWNVERSNTEIVAFKDRELTNSETGLLAYYKMDDGSGTTLTDELGGSNGTINGGATFNTSGPPVVTPLAGPEIALFGNLVEILNNDFTPDLGDDTDYADVIIGNTEIKTFTIVNTGDTDLTVSDIQLSGGEFSVGFAPGAPAPYDFTITSGGSEEFDINFDPTIGGGQGATINVLSDDSDESTYSYDILGNGLELQNALSFDGVDDYVEIPDAAGLDITGGITLETWVKFDAPVTEETPLITKWNPDAPNERSYSLFINNSSEIWMAVSATGLSTTEGTDISYVSVPFDFEAGRWYHIAGTFSPFSSARVFVNGEMIAEKFTDMVGSIHSGTSPVALAANGNAASITPGTMSTGIGMEMDEVRIWDVAKNDFELDDYLYTELSGFEPNLVAYYDFNETSGTTLIDRTSNGNGGTLFNDNDNTPAADGVTDGPIWGSSGAFAPTAFIASDMSQFGFRANWNQVNIADQLTIEWSADNFASAPLGSTTLFGGDATDRDERIDYNGFSPNSRYQYRIQFTDGSFTSPYSNVIEFFTGPGSALNFDGTNDYVDLGSEIRDQFAGTSNITVEAWVYRTVDKSFHTIVGNYNGALQFLLRIDSNKPSFWINNGSQTNVLGTTDVPLNTWTHLAGTWDGTIMRVYLNGVEDGSTGLSGSMISAGGNFNLGGDFPTVPAELMQGSIDEVRIWNQSLDATSIQENLYEQINPQNHSSLIGYYRFDEADGGATNTGLIAPEIEDLSGKANDGSMVGFAKDGATSNWVVSSALASGALPLDPSNVHTQTTQFGDRVFVDWVAPDGADITGSEIERDTDPGFGSAVSFTTSSQGEFEDVTVSPNTDYFYRVRHINSAGNSGWSSGEVATTRAYPGTAFDFDGSTYITATSGGLAIGGLSTFSIDFWINLDALDATIFDITGVGGNRLNITASGAIQLVDGSLNTLQTEDGALSADSRWHHITITNAGSGNGKIYVDGTELFATSNSFDSFTAIANDLAVGARDVLTTPAGHIDGRLDELRIWDYEWLSEEITELMFYDPEGDETLFHYKFDVSVATSPTTVHDRSQNYFDGSVTGTKTLMTPDYINALVTNTGDSGTGSLREAINYANANPGTRIQFNIDQPAPWIIYLASDLPNITAQGTIIDGTTQPGWDIATGNIPQINGQGSASIGLNFASSNQMEVYGLHMHDFTVAGIRFNVVGGTPNGYTFGAPDKGNIITNSGSAGINILSYLGGGTIQSNYIGIMPDGSTSGMGNTNGISLGTNANNAQIGGLIAGEENVISNNTTSEISISGGDMAIVQGNILGLSPDEMGAPGAGSGININGSNDATIEQNVISGHTNGIRINNSSGHTIIRNNIGVASDGFTQFPNATGINIINNINSNDNIIGSSTNAGDGNIIAFNVGDAVLIDGSGNTGNQIQRNSIFNNTSGISLTGGANNGISPPTIDLISDPSQVTGTGIDGDEVDLYLSDGNGQGQNYLGSATVSGGVWIVSSLSLSNNSEVVATSTNATDGTSEFSVSQVYSEEENYALDFDGIDDHVQVATPAGFPVGSAPRTLEFWFKSNVDISSDQNHGLVQYGSVVTSQMFGLITSSNSPGTIYFYGTNDDLAGTTTLSQDQWYHAAVTYDGTNVNLYLDGNLESTKTATLNTIINGDGLTIGRRPLSEHFWNGQIDEVRLWDYARTEEEIQLDMNNVLVGNEIGLVAYYPLQDGPSSTDVSDVTGGGNDGVLVSMDENTDWVAGPTFGNPPGGSSIFEDFESGTVPSADYSGTLFLGSGDWESMSLSPESINVFSGLEAISFNQPGDYLQSFEIAEGVNDVSFFVNQTNGDGAEMDVLYSTDGGSIFNSAGQTGFFAYTEYEEFIIPVGTTEPTIIRIEAVTTNEPIYLDDITINIGGEAPNSGDFALDFDGVDDHLVAPDVSELGITNGTLEAWIHPNSLALDGSATQRVLAKPSGLSNADSPYQLIVTDAGAIGLILGDGGASVSFNSNDGLVQTSTWQHIAVSWDGSNVRFYYNGVEDLVVPQGAIIPNSNASSLIIGGFNGTGGLGQFNGAIDDVRIWDIARSEPEIDSNKDFFLEGSESGLVAYYPMVDGTGSVDVTDFTPNGNNATLTNMDENVDWVPEPGTTFMPAPESFFEEFDDEVLPSVASSGPLNLSSGMWDGEGLLESGDIDAREGVGNAIQIMFGAGNYLMTPHLEDASNFSFWHKSNGDAGTYDIYVSDDGGSTHTNFIGSVNPDPVYQEFTHNFGSAYYGSVRIEYNTGASPLFADDFSSDGRVLMVPVLADLVPLSIQSMDVEFEVNVDVESDLYYVVTYSTTQPSPTQIVFGTDEFGAPAVVANSLGTVAGTYQFNIGGLDPATNYYVHMVANNSGVYSDVLSYNFVTENPPLAVNFASVNVPGQDLLPGSTDNLIYELSVTPDEEVTTIGFILTLDDANYNPTDFPSDPFTVWMDSDDDFAGATSLGSFDFAGTIPDGPTVAENQVALLFAELLPAGVPTYLFVTVDISAGAASGNSFIPLAIDPENDFGIEEETIVSGTPNAGNLFTIQAIAAPNVLAASGVTATDFTANWQSTAGAIGYFVDVATDATFNNILPDYEDFDAGNSVGLFVSNLDFRQNYYYRVRADYGGGNVSTNSSSQPVKTDVDATTLADSTALVQIFTAVNPQGLNWTTARLRDWDGVTLNLARTRVRRVDFPNASASGNMPNPFAPATDIEKGPLDMANALSIMNRMNVSNNEITGLMDFTPTVMSNLNVSGNALEFDDLEPLVGITTLSYADQANVQFQQYTDGTPLEVRYNNDYSLNVGSEGLGVGGSSNIYTWYRNNEVISTGSEFFIGGFETVILAIGYENMGEFRVEVTSTLVPELIIDVDPQIVWAIADMEVVVSDVNGDPLSAAFNAYMLETTRTATGFRTLETLENLNSSSFTFPDVVLGDYITFVESDIELYIPTYYGDVFEWTDADTLFFRSDEAINMVMTEVPPILGPGDGDGTLDVLIEDDFGEDDGRIDARRRAAKRKCGLRKRRRGGRTGQDDDEFELIAYGETDDNGEFQFGFLPEGTYRFFVEYPGIPLDQSASVEFEVGEAGVSDTDFKLQAFATEDGIEITIEAVLGVILEYFKDLQIYPNPSSEFLNVSYRHLKSNDVTAQLVDLAGNTKWSADLQNGFDGQIKIDVSEFSEGVYILRFYDRENPKDNVVSYRVMVR